MTERKLKLWADGNDRVFVYVKPATYVRSFVTEMGGKTTDEKVENAKRFIKDTTDKTDTVLINGTPADEWLKRYPIQKDMARERKTTRAVRVAQNP